ncbi:MAG: hypothetical protein KC586_25770 [Myxococcales bacterium]|nr:hypothetical protein [Myxococcales bacterium]
MRRVSVLVLTLGVLGALTTLSTASVAEAQEGRPTYIGFGLGPTVGLRGGGVAFKLEESVGYHVLEVGDHPGLFVGGALAQSFAGGSAVLAFGGRVGFDARVFHNSSLSLLVSPHTTVGASVSIIDVGDGGGRQTSGAFNLGFAGEVRLVMADDRATVWVRPIGFDLHISKGVGANYDILVGGSYNF